MTSKPGHDNHVVFWYGLAAVALGIAWSSHGTITTTFQGRPRDEFAKPFRDLDSFYGFYLEEHRDTTCRILHVIGTTVASVGILRSGILPHLLVGISFGLVLCEFLSPLPNGSIEFGSVAAVSALSYYAQTKQTFPWKVLVMGYLPAWIGHYFFEHNTPATFIYPTYSLISDYRMWSQMMQGELAWCEQQ